MKQAERFGVAILAFCLKYDASFRQHFLRVICGSDEIPDLQRQSFRVLVDPSCTWADLLLESDRHVIVVECKVNEGLEEKQNPAEIAFEQAGGYGYLFAEHYLDSRYHKPSLHYVVLMKRSKFLGTKRVHGVRCLSRTWDALVRPTKPETLEADLCNSLGSLGYDAFQYMKTKKSVIGSDASKVPKAMVILENVARKSELGTLPWQFEVQEPEKPDGSVGKDINMGRKKRINKLRALVRPEGPGIAWFGYETYDRQTFLSVWFYCKDNKGESSVRKRVTNQKLLHRSKRPGEDHFVNVRLEASKSQGDQEWFVSVLEPFFS